MMIAAPSRRAAVPYQGQFRFIRTHNMELVRQIMTVPRTFRWITEDGSLPANLFQPEDHPAILWLLVRDGQELIGCYSMRPETSVCYDVHCALLPLATWVRGRSVASLEALFEWVWRETNIQRVTARVPVFNRLALQLAEKAQMIRFGENVKSFPKHGKLWNEILLGISRPGAT